MLPTGFGYCIFTFEGGDWSRDDFDGLRRGFAAASELGYSYVEVPSLVYSAGPGRSDAQFLHRVGRVLDMTDHYGVPLSAIFAAAAPLDVTTREVELDQLTVLARLVSTAGITHLPVTLSMGASAAGVQDAAELGRIMSAAGSRTLDVGVQLAVHPHIDCPVETPEQIDAFFAAADPATVSMCLDTGHVLAGGGDPVEIAKRYADRICYVHLKDVDVAAYRQATGRAARYGAFRDPGEGDVDFGGVMRALRAGGFRGPVLAENDLSPDPAASMASAMSYLQKEIAPLYATAGS